MREAIEQCFGLEERYQVQQAEAVRQNDEILAEAGLANQDDLDTPRTEEERSADEIPVTTPDGKKIRLIR